MEDEQRQVETVRDTEGGNTISPSPVIKLQQNQYQYWCFTYNNYEIEQIERLEQIFKHCCNWYVFQEEVGEKGTPHLQGTIYLKKKERLTAMLKIDQKIHWEPTKCVSASIAYCNKKDTAVGKVYNYGINIPEPIEVDEPYG